MRFVAIFNVRLSVVMLSADIGSTIMLNVMLSVDLCVEANIGMILFIVVKILLERSVPRILATQPSKSIFNSFSLTQGQTL
jgi:hypothetical protein